MVDYQRRMTDLETVIFIIDDDESIRKSLSRLLRASGFNVETYASSEEFLSREPYQGIGCIVLDISMPGLSGMELHDELIRARYGLPIVFITGHGDIPMSVRAMKKGAVDFLLKPFDQEELLQALEKAIESDRKAKTEEVERRRVIKLVEELTPREREIVPYIISGMLNKQIAFTLGISEKTVKIHRSRIMEKLGAHSIVELIHLAEKADITPHTL